MRLDDDDYHALGSEHRIEMDGVASLVVCMQDENVRMMHPSQILEEKQKSCKFSKIHLHSDTINYSSCIYSRQTRVPSEKVSIERTFQSSSLIKGISIALGGRGILWREMLPMS